VYSGAQVKEVLAQGVGVPPRHETNNPIDWQGIENFLEQAV
jgi:hypothetical protein